MVGDAEGGVERADRGEEADGALPLRAGEADEGAEAGKVGMDGCAVVLEHDRKRHGAGKAVGDAVKPAEGVGDGVDVADACACEGAAGVEGGAEHPLARGEGLSVAAGDGEITENIAHGGLRERAGLARVVVKAQVGLDRVGEGVHARLRGDGGRERERERGVEDGVAGDQAEVADGVFTVLLSGDDGGDGGL